MEPRSRPTLAFSASLAFASLAIGLPSGSAEASPRERLVGGPCDGCEAVFQGRPRRIGTSARIAGPDEKGEPLVLEGTVTDAAGRAAPGIIVYAYHTDAGGEYPRVDRPGEPAASRHGRLRGFARTDSAGRYRFETIRPAAYPGREVPQHVHMHVLEPGRCHYYIDDVLFTDDPLLTERQRSAHPGRGGSGIVTARRARSPSGAQAWTARRDIRLGAGIDDYARCGAP
jgi:protocatechuate 3,4-dioxygenase, beta subunit